MNTVDISELIAPAREPEITRSPDDMTMDELHDYLGSPEFAERAAVMRRRVETGEVMTMEYLAHGLGLPFLFFAECVAIKVLEKDPTVQITISNDKGVIN